LGGGVGDGVRGREVVEETEVAEMSVVVTEERACGGDMVVEGDTKGVKGIEFGPGTDDLLMILVQGPAAKGVFGCVCGSREEVMGLVLFWGKGGVNF